MHSNMKKYLFILGRNVALSIAEIESYLKKECIDFEIISNVKNGLLVETKDVLPTGIVDRLGGVISLGEVLATGSLNKVKKELDKSMIYFGTGNKLNYVVFDFDGDYHDDILVYLKHRFKEEKLKATEKKPTGNIKMQEGEFAPNVKSNLIDEQYFVFKDNFGKIIEECDYDAVELRDMKKPVKRNELTISPRLAKILINLSEVKRNEILLDPFCGIGTVLQEALLQGVKVVGVDKDKNAIHNAEINLKWFNFDKDNYKLIYNDSSSVKIPKVDALATEPDLGELQKTVPSPDKAMKIILGFEKLIIHVLNNVKEKVDGRIVFTAPFIKTGKKRVGCDFDKIAKETGLKIVDGFPLHEFRESSIVGRSIIVMK